MACVVVSVIVLLIVELMWRGSPPEQRLVVGTVVLVTDNHVWLRVAHVTHPRRSPYLRIAHRGKLPPNMCRGHRASVTAVLDRGGLVAHEITVQTL